MKIIPCVSLAIALAASGYSSPTAAAASTLAVYPGAKKMALPNGMSAFSVTECGVKMTIVDYKVRGASITTVAQWYADRMPGGIRVRLSPNSRMTADSVFAPDGSSLVSAIKTTVDPDLAKISGHTDDAVTLGLITYEPNLPQDILNLVIAVSRHGSDAKAAHDQLKARCPEIAGQ